MRAGEDANHTEIVSGTELTPLIRASYDGNVLLAKLLLKYGAQVDLQNNDGWSALMAASQNGHTEAVTLLHEYGCLLYTSPSPRDATLSRMPSSA